ncbi:family 16 glycosylhydrolase [Winogradskyella litoriviva]|uniref:Family 16 glycosylhydrolase n=1 Tax=Winogradskyella litoriviva TaxID=1220182 RepID=A0ABX2E5G7_9FLAO|nr:family 16 glycosylhydrolase [Winogradskyella litoriviva]
MKYLFLSILGVVLLFTSCQEDDISFGDITAPKNVTITAEIVGQDTDNPYGDGTGFVNFVATADDEISYKFDFGDGTSEVAPNGTVTHRYTSVGVNPFTVVVSAIGTGGTMSSTALEIELYSSFTDPEAETFLSGANVGDSKTWYWAANVALHVGLGPVDEDYGNGEFAYEAWWNAIQPFDEEKSCMYTNEFVFTKTADGLTFEQTVGPAFVPGTYADILGVATGDTCYDETVIPSMFGVKDVSFFPSSSMAALEGTYNDQPYRQSSFSISDGGFMGWYVGSVEYDIISISETEMQVRFIQEGGGYAWYAKFQTQNPFEVDDFPTLTWSDEFDTNGAPDSANWTYDLGAGGWGNQEVQTYTDNAENVSVQDGVLKITAKADGSGGYTSTRLKSQGLQEFTYGRVEIRAKLPSSQGTWPALWMLGANFSDVGWPACGEIDIMEQTGDNKTNILGTCHWFDSGTNAGASYGEITEVADSTSEFHVYSLEWTEESLRIFVDGTAYYTLTNSEDLPFYDKDFFFIMNIAMGGTLGGTIDPAFTEDSMEVDYIRVYQ